MPEIPALGYKAFKVIKKEMKEEIIWPIRDQLIIEKDRIENKYYQIRLNKKGQIISLHDKEFQREILPKGSKANVFQAFEDRPMSFDAWDIDIYYQDKKYIIDDLVEIEVEETGPDRGVIRFKWCFLDSVSGSHM